MSEKNRAELIMELEKIFDKRVFAIVYNPADEEGIKHGDEIYFEHFIETIIKRENIKECIFILSGFGGNLKTAVLCSEILRKNIEKYICFIPSVACSSICYFVLQSDRLIIGDRSILTQIDPIFNYDGEDLRAIKHLNDPDPRIRMLAHSYYNPVFEQVKRLIKTPPHVFEKEVSKRAMNKTDYFVKLVDAWMGKELHERGLTIKDLKELKVKFDIANNEIVTKARILVQECLNELMNENQRFIIQTNKIEDKYYGGFFYP